jgi:hypothetical protein
MIQLHLQPFGSFLQPTTFAEKELKTRDLEVVVFGKGRFGHHAGEGVSY